MLVTLGLSATPVATAIARASETNATSPQTAPLLAQANTCRRVTPNINGLNVRQSPTLTADVIGVVPGGSTISLENTGQNGWVPITAPFDGYVSASYLIYCDSAATEPGGDAAVASTPVADAAGVCRQVIVRSGLNVRAEPTVYSLRVGALPTGTNVTAAGAEVNDWLPISEPIDGYVAARFLGDC
ncbi:SH3 domain-containing protein [Nodosilinea sp. AN01ver1]|uniref:SH3 domain-containing protein n=1 Tax=Nodosilinea sp. AN01ver1 TaxID=3423362 RepID=UPI003D31EF9D